MSATFRGAIVAAALLAGFGTGALARRHAAGARAGGTSPEARPRTPSPRPAGRAPFRASPDPAALPAPPPPAPATETLRRQAATLRDAVQRAAADGDGRALLRLIRQLAALGEAGFADAAGALALVTADGQGEWPALGVSEEELSSLLLNPDLASLEAWIVSDPAHAPAAVRALAARFFAFSPDLDPVPTLLAALLEETDAGVARRLAAGMRRASASDLPALMAAARAQAGRGDAGPTIVLWMARRGGVEALPWLTELRASPDGRIAEEALVQSRILAPPETGALVTGVAPGADTPLRRGDIIVSCDGAPVQESRQWAERVSGWSAGRTATLLVRRGDELVTVVIEKKPEGIGTRTVTRRKD